VHAAAPLVVSAFLLLTLALLSILGVMAVGRWMPPEARQAARPALLPIPVKPKPARPRPAAIVAAGQLLRAPPTFPDQPIDPYPRRMSGG
jgi:hypothetical protein